MDLKPVFIWANENGDANISDRILVKVLPILLKSKINLTTSIIDSSDVIDVPENIYKLVLQKTEELIGSSYRE